MAWRNSQHRARYFGFGITYLEQFDRHNMDYFWNCKSAFGRDRIVCRCNVVIPMRTRSIRLCDRTSIAIYCVDHVHIGGTNGLWPILADLSKGLEERKFSGRIERRIVLRGNRVSDLLFRGQSG